MELFGLLFAAPVTLVASTVYCIVAAVVFTKLPNVRNWAMAGSLLVVFCLLIEVFALRTLGAKPAYSRLGNGFTIIHFTVFLLGPPAVANILLLLSTVRNQGRKLLKIALASLICWFACMGALLGNIAVDEAIVGIDADVPFYMTKPE